MEKEISGRYVATLGIARALRSKRIAVVFVIVEVMFTAWPSFALTF
jgi:hypothetical protein